MAVDYNTKTILNGLIVYLDAANSKSYPGTGTTWSNLISSNFNASLTNSPTYSSNGYFTFDGINQGASITNTNYPAAWTDPFSIEVWFRVPTSATWSNGFIGTIVIRGSFAGTQGFGRSTIDNRITSYIRGDDAAQIATAIASGLSRDTWHNGVINWDGSTTSIFVNGVLIQTSSTTTQTGVPESGNWLIATASAFGGNTGNFFTGDISVVKIYNIALNSAQVLTNYEAFRRRYNI